MAMVVICRCRLIALSRHCPQDVIDLIAAIEKYFGMPQGIVREVVNGLKCCRTHGLNNSTKGKQTAQASVNRTIVHLTQHRRGSGTDAL